MEKSNCIATEKKESIGKNIVMVSTVPYYFLLNLALKEGLQLLLISFIGVSCSSMLGSIIGVVAKSQIVVGTISSPVSMIIGLLPMMSNFSSDLKKLQTIYTLKEYMILFIVLE